MTELGTKAGRSNQYAIPGFGLAAVLACLWGALGTPPSVIAPLAWIGVLWIPGAALTVGRRRMKLTDDALWIPFATGPVLFGVGICVGRLLGIPLGVSALAVTALGFIALVIRLAPWRRDDRNGAASEATGDARGATVTHETADFRPHDPASAGNGPKWHRILPLAVGLGVVMLGILPPLLHAPIRMRDDALLHLPAVQRILAGSFPPENPFLAGTPFAYFWFYHVVLAGTARLTAIPLDLVPVFLNLQALAVLLLALNRLGRRLGLSPAARAAGLALFGLGLSPWGWMRLVYVHLTRPDISWALVKAYGVSGILPMLGPEDPRLAAALTKVYMTNALPMSLALFALAATPVRRPSAGAWLRRATTVAGCLFFHMAAGLMLVAGLGTAWVVERIWPGKNAGAAPSGPGPAAEASSPRSNRGLGLGALAALAGGAAVTIPYLLDVLNARTGAGAVTFVFQPEHALDLHLALAGVWILALPVLLNWLRSPESRAWLAVGFPALVLPFAVHLVDGNEYKSIFVLLVLLAPAAGAGLARLTGNRAWLMGLVLLVFLPTPWLAARAYMTETPPGYPTPADRRLAREIGASMPREAVTWRVDPGEGYSAFTLPLGRPSYVSDPYALRILGQWNSEEARWRRGSLELALKGRVDQALIAAQSRLPGRPLYPLVTRNDAMRFPRLSGELTRLGYREVGRHPRFTLYAPPATGEPGAPKSR